LRVPILWAAKNGYEKQFSFTVRTAHHSGCRIGVRHDKPCGRAEARPSKGRKGGKFMRTTFRILFAALLLAVFLVPGTASAFFGATATIVDAETGEPIEGAIALAQWMKTRYHPMNGFTSYLIKAKETTSNKKGKIYISGFWSLLPFTGKPHLTVYKPGYALWNSEKDVIPVKNPPSKGFNRFTKVVRLVRFEKAAEDWKNIAYSEFDKYYPRKTQSAFLDTCLESGLDTNPITMFKIFMNYEVPSIKEESDQMRRRYEKKKK